MPASAMNPNLAVAALGQRTARVGAAASRPLHRLVPPAERKEAGKALLAKSTYALFYLLLTIMVLTGLVLVWADNVPLLHQLKYSIKEVHNVTRYFIIAFVSVHVARVVWAEATNEHGFISRMVGGPGQSPAR